MTASPGVAQPTAQSGQNSSSASTRAPRFLGLAWVAWRQQRAALLILAVLAAGLSAQLLVSGLNLRAAIAAITRAHCASVSQACQPLYDRASAYVPGWTNGLIVLPVVAAVFVAAPLLARGYETGALRFAVTQGVRRARWAVPQFLVPAVTGVVLCVVSALAGAWHLSQLTGSVIAGPWRWGPVSFNFTPLMLPCWLLLGLSAGMLAGVVFRRTVPAIGATLAGTTIVAYVIEHWRLLPDALLPIGTSATRLVGPMWTYCSGPVCSFGDPAGQSYGSGVIVRGWFARGGGHALTSLQTNALASRIPQKLLPAANPAARPESLERWLAARHYSYWISFQPGTRYWLFQGVQAALLVALAIALAGLAIWLLRRRPA
jgi:hypothetical protein